MDRRLLSSNLKSTRTGFAVAGGDEELQFIMISFRILDGLSYELASYISLACGSYIDFRNQ